MEQENRVRMERIAADPQSGLSAEQVKRRFAQGENNVVGFGNCAFKCLHIF